MAALESDSDEEDFVSYGTPLEPLAEGEQVKKPIPVQEQSVKDEKGRYKRFHGAFTGGFSAGYFNTVGSKEGWTPSTFVSSRQGRADRQVLRPEDFMDEEDLGEHGIAPKEIMTTDDFASKTKDRIKEKAKLLAAVTAPIPGASILEDLIAPAKLTIGVELLRKMGWKEGQGVGPRTKRKPCKQKPAPGVKVYGCALPPQGSEGSEDDEDEYLPENVTFAPKDVMPIDFTIKDNVRGLGYKGLDPCQALFGVSEHISLFTNESKDMNNLLRDTGCNKGRKLGISGQAFGVGALEEEDADIYSTDSLSKYDTVISEEDPRDGLFGWTAPKEYRNQKGLDKEVKYVGKILDGFSFASAPSCSCKIYPPPELPRDYRPVHYFKPIIAENIGNSLVLQSLLESSSGHQNDTAPQSRHGLSSSQRRDLLGEMALQGPTSVLELLSEKDRVRIQEVKDTMEQQQVKAKQETHLALNSQFQPATVDHTPYKHQIVAGGDMAATVSGEFQPFAKNPEKQKRYEDYLGNLKQGRKDALERCLDPNMTEWERGRERDEFVRAALLYRSSSSTLSSRFTRAKYEDDKEKVDVPRDQESDVTDKAAAVKMKMFGKLTRDQFEWHPEKLLCKRFNVPDPYPGSTVVGLPTVKRDKYSVFNFLSIPETPPPKICETKSEKVHSENNSNKPKKQSRWDMPAEDKKKDSVTEFISLARSKMAVQMQQVGTSVEKSDTVEQVATEAAGESTDQNEEEESRPPMDLFKAIFASSSDEKSSSSDENEEEEEENQIMQSNAKSPESLEIPVPDTIISSVQDDKAATSEPVLPVPTPIMQTQEPDSEEFGPRLPPVFSSVSPLKPEAELPSPAEAPRKQKQKKNRDKSKNKREHKHKKEKKKKHKKHKHRSKHKKKSENNSSEDTADSSDIHSDTEEITKLSPHELLKRLKHLPLP
ncbi:G patch domain-containing protein 1 isoform X2 [Microcaecilia unicolor]|uniref:G patch domain-containing protein 1 isoform X2 n=1 Tax=Microcaecilia unicolor TaxID=1415580 RepID=A0A6P7Y5Q7_9AMPH|nr:G patch domain-containing protein 1 isoform X2 [Microcaecilia unicolor]